LLQIIGHYYFALTSLQKSSTRQNKTVKLFSIAAPLGSIKILLKTHNVKPQNGRYSNNL